MKINRILVLWGLFLCLSLYVHAGDEPRWMSKLPNPSNSSFYYTRVEALATDIQSAKNLCLKYLAARIELEQSVRISEVGTTRDRTSSKMENGRFTESINTESDYSFRVEGSTVDLTAKLIDEYITEVVVGGRNMLKMHTLYAVAHRGNVAVFDDISFSRYYGMQGFVRSLVPGWGQMYKGSMAKGICILSGEIACVAGIIVSENLRASYVKKMHEQPKFASTYNSKADNWETGRNICIGAAAALYVYNLVDAVAAKGAKRIVVKPRQRTSFSLTPAVMKDGYGLAFTYNF